MRNADYWRGRFSILEDSAHREAQKTIQDMEELYLDTQRSVQKEIESWYARFAVNNQISLTDARKWLTAGQLEEFHWSVEQYIKIGEQAGLDAAWLKKLENASTRFHISRLEAVQTGIQQQLELLYGNQVDSLDALLKKVVGNGYTRTAFEVQKGVGLGWDITGLDQKKLETLLSKPWTTDGRTFRDRCWLNKNDLVGSVSKSLTQGLLRGDSPAKITTAIQKQFGVHRYKAGRLVNTETTYFNAVATKECYKDLDVEMVEIIETLDSHTCSICGGLDGKVIPISQYEPGVTVPPFHPNCRGTTAPAIDPKYPGITVDDYYIDIMTANLLKEPLREQFQVVLLPNLYGDIITDEAAQIQGGVGTAGSANVGDRYAMFEAIHGSAPRMIERGMGDYANPASIIKAAAMLLRHICRADAAARLEKAMAECKVEVKSDGTAATAAQYADAVMALL